MESWHSAEVSALITSSHSCLDRLMKLFSILFIGAWHSYWVSDAQNAVVISVDNTKLSMWEACRVEKSRHLSLSQVWFRNLLAELMESPECDSLEFSANKSFHGFITCKWRHDRNPQENPIVMTTIRYVMKVFPTARPILTDKQRSITTSLDDSL